MTSPAGQSIKRGLKRAVPRPARAKIREALFSHNTVSEGWDRWAKWYSGREGEYLGDEWNDPQEMGLEVAQNEIPSYLFENVFGPFIQTPAVLLEIGPGGGRFTELLLPHCKRLIAADTSPHMLKLLRSRFGEHAQIEYMLLDGKRFTTIADGSVDAAFSYDVFIHLQHWDIYNYLVELKRVLKPGGKALIHHAHTFSALGWRQFCREVPVSIGRHKAYNTFSVMTPDLMKGFVERADLKLLDCLTDVIPRDCVSLLQAPT